MNSTIVTIVGYIIVGYIIRVIFYFYMIRKYEIKICIPLALYGLFEMTYMTIKLTLE